MPVNRNILEETFTWAEVKEMYMTTVNGKVICKNNRNQTLLNNLKDGWKSGNQAYSKDKFYGATTTEMVKYLHDGYRVKGLSLDPPITPIRKRRRLQFAEEGELQYDLALSGFDYPYLSWTKRESTPGMRIDIETGFLSSTKAKVISDYYTWVLKALVALETSGIDLEVWATSRASDFVDSNYRLTTTIHFQVKKEGEQTDYLSWSAVLSPGGHRHLMFLARTKAADMNKLVGNSSMGSSANRGPFRVTFNAETRTLSFNCPSTPSSFPEEEMNNQLLEVLVNARRSY